MNPVNQSGYFKLSSSFSKCIVRKELLPFPGIEILARFSTLISIHLVELVSLEATRKRFAKNVKCLVSSMLRLPWQCRTPDSTRRPWMDYLARASATAVSITFWSTSASSTIPILQLLIAPREKVREPSQASRHKPMTIQVYQSQNLVTILTKFNQITETIKNDGE